MTPAPYTSAAGPERPWLMDSGAMYCGVPSSPVVVRCRSAITDAMPKSDTRTSPVAPEVHGLASSTLSGFTSRWVTSCSCAAARASSVSAVIVRASRGGSVPAAASRSRAEPPPTRSMTIASRSPSTTRSRTRTIDGCCRPSSTVRSRTKRSTTVGSAASSARSSFAATCSPVAVCSARQTSPVAPVPSRSTSRYDAPSGSPRPYCARPCSVTLPPSAPGRPLVDLASCYRPGPRAYCTSIA